MKGWITATLLVTFFSGASTGFLVGRESAPAPKVLTKIDRYVERARADGVTAEADLEQIRALYEEREKQIWAYKNRINTMFDQQLARIDEEFESEIREILARYKGKR